MITGIIGAMEQEVALLRDKIEKRKTLSHSGCEIYTGQLHGANVALLKSGIGKVAAATGTTLLLEHCRPDNIINTGTAGALSPELHVGDIVVSDAVCYHDVDLTAFGYQPGQMAGCPVTFTPDPGLISLAERCIQQLQLTAVRGLVCSGDSFINGALPRTRINTLFPTAIAVEMEAAAIGHVCQQFKVPFVVIRAISDTADQQSHLSFEQFLSLAAKKSTLMVETMLQALNHERSTSVHYAGISSE